MNSTLILLLSLIFYQNLMVQNAGYFDTPLKLWYKSPATAWEEALPVGNGRLGAMVFGNAVTEKLQLNEESIWAGIWRRIIYSFSNT